MKILGRGGGKEDKTWEDSELYIVLFIPAYILFLSSSTAF
jgi:hypothetical protein